MTPTGQEGSARALVLLAVAVGMLAVAAFLALGADGGGRLPGAVAESAEPGPEPAPGAAGVAPAGDAPEEVGERAEVTQPGPEDRPPPPDACLPLTGVVVDADGRPVAGAEVIVVEELGAGFMLLAEGRQEEERGRGVTDRDGRFALAVPFARRLKLRVRAEGFAPEEVEPCYAGEHHQVVLQRGAALEVRVTDAATGDPVGGVLLYGWRDGDRVRLVDGRSAADGTFRFDDLPPCTLVLNLTPPAHENLLRQEIALRVGETARLDIELQRGGTVFGTVTDAATGLPIAGAEIGGGWTFRKAVRTDAAGRYRMQGAPGPGVSDMHARAPGYAQASAGAHGDGEQRIDFALRRAGSVRGRVVDESGAPQAGVYVAADADLGTVAGLGRTDWQYARSGGDGMFRIGGLVPGAEYTLLVRHRGRATKAFHLSGKVDPDRELDAGDLVLEAPAVLMGRVVNAQGHGIPAAMVSLRGTNDDCDRLLAAGERGHRDVPYHASNREARTDAEGRFRFADLAAGTYDVGAFVAGGPSGERKDVRVAGGETTAGVEIAIDLGEVLAGRVVTEDGSPLPQLVSVHLAAAGGERGSSVFTRVARDGTFRALGLQPGRYHLQVTVSSWVNDDLAPWLGEDLEDVATGREDLRLVLRRAAFLTGMVVDAQGRPRKGIVVTVVQQGHGGGARDLTDGEGRFRLRVARDAVVDLRYGEALPSEHPFPNPPRPETARLYRGARAGATELVLELR